MGGGKKKRPAWAPYLGGLLLTLGVYLVGHMLLALLGVRGTIGEGAAFPATAVLCLLAAAGGGVLAGRWAGKPVSAVGTAALFAAILVCCGLSTTGAKWTGRDGVVLLCALCGGVASVPAAGKRKRGIQHRRR